MLCLKRNKWCFHPKDLEYLRKKLNIAGGAKQQNKKITCGHLMLAGDQTAGYSAQNASAISASARMILQRLMIEGEQLI